MISRRPVTRTLNHQPIDRHRDWWLLPATQSARGDEVAEMEVRFPSDFLHLDAIRIPARKESRTLKIPAIIYRRLGLRLESRFARTVSRRWPCRRWRARPRWLPITRPPNCWKPALRQGQFRLQRHGSLHARRMRIAPAGAAWTIHGQETAFRELAEGHVELRNLLAPCMTSTAAR